MAPRSIPLPLVLTCLCACFTPEPEQRTDETSTGAESSSSSSTGSTGSSTAVPPETSASSEDADSSSSTAAADSSSSDAESSSTGEPATCLGSSAPFGEPVPLAGLNTDAGELRPWLSEDELVVYFASNRAGGPGGMDLFVATRDDVGAAFDEPMRLAIATDAEETSPALTADGLELYFTYNYDTYVASRDSLVAEFGPPAAVAGINDAAGDYHPWVSGDGDVLYFNSERTGNSEIFMTERGPGGTFSAPEAVGELNSEATEDFPVLSSDQLTIFFGSTRLGGAGESDIWMATRSTVDDGFGDPIDVAELNTAEQDLPGWLSPDGCRLYLSRYVAGTRDLFVAERSG